MKRSRIFYSTTFLLFVLAALNLYSFKLLSKSESPPQVMTVKSISSLTPGDLLNKTTALSIGIKGVILVYAPGWRLANYTVKAGDTLMIPVLIQFRSYDTSIQEVIISLSSNPGEIEQVYAITDANGNVIERQTLDISSLESYSPSTITLQTGETMQVTMSLTIPQTIPDLAFYLSACGVKILWPSGVTIAPIYDFLVEVVIVH